MVDLFKTVISKSKPRQNLNEVPVQAEITG
jgi:hypothetical protein